MTDEQVAEQAVETVAKDTVSDVKADVSLVKPDVVSLVAHIEAFGEIVKSDIGEAIAYLKAKL